MQHGDSSLPSKFKARIPVVGNLKIGDVEGGSGSARPKKLDYMRICGPSPTNSGTYPNHPSFKDFNDAKKRELTIELVADDPSVNLEVVYAMAGRGAILCRGNGVSAERRLNDRGAMVSEAPFVPVAEGECGEKCPFFKQAACKLASTLRFRIPGHTDMGAIYQFRTTSWNTAQDLLGAMQNLSAMTGGVLARMPLRLFMHEQRRQIVANGKRTGSSFWTLGVSFDGSEEDLIAAVSKANKLKADMKALSIPTLEDRLRTQESDLLTGDLTSAEELAIAAEFFPGVPTTIPAADPAQEVVDENNAAEAGPTPSSDEPASTTVGASAASIDGEAKAPEAQASTLDQPEAPAPAPAPAPTTATADLITPSQRGMILKHAARVAGVDSKKLETLLKPWTKKQASTWISDQLLKSAETAFKGLGVVA